MKYYLIAGEASGDLHASHLITSIRREDPQGVFRFFGGDMMAEAAKGCGTLVRHYRELAYMGFIPVLLHLPTILRGIAQCKADITEWKPDCVIFVDYAGFNLRIAKFLREQQKSGSDIKHTKLFYYIAPKIWAWKEHRIKNFKRDIDEMFSILPFEKDFFEKKHHYPIHYVGNPTASEVREFLNDNENENGNGNDNGNDNENHNGNGNDNENENENHNENWDARNILAILPGSRRQEITSNLPSMLEAARLSTAGTQTKTIVAGAPGIERDFYDVFLKGHEDVEIVFGQTYDLLAHSRAALVTSGTATLETCCFNVPQVVCYKVTPAKVARWAFNHLLKCDYISLVNLIAGREVVPELFADRFSVENIHQHLTAILHDGKEREAMLKGYAEVHRRLGTDNAPDNAAKIMTREVKSE